MAPHHSICTKNDVEDNIATCVWYRFPGVDYLLLKFVEEGVVLLRLADLLLIVWVNVPLELILVVHLNILFFINTIHPIKYLLIAQIILVYLELISFKKDNFLFLSIKHIS